MVRQQHVFRTVYHTWCFKNGMLLFVGLLLKDSTELDIPALNFFFGDLGRCDTNGIILDSQGKYSCLL